MYYILLGQQSVEIYTWVYIYGQVNESITIKNKWIVLNIIQIYQFPEKYQIIVELKYQMATYRNINKYKYIETKIGDRKAIIAW